MSRTPDKRLADSADLFRTRNKQYGANYTKFGPIMASMFPDGISCAGEEELGRLILFAHLFTKLTRYAQNMNRGGHEDSLDDMAVYAMMLAEHDEKHRVHMATMNPVPTAAEMPSGISDDGDEWRRDRVPVMPVRRPTIG